MAGNPPEIADQLHAAVSRAVFRVPLGDWVKYALGYKAVVVESLLASLCDIRDGLQMAFQDSPWTRHTYINIEKILQLSYSPLALWVVASGLSNPPFSLQVALASILNLKFVLAQLAVTDQRFAHINQNYKWNRWPTDFYETVYQAPSKDE